MFLLLFIFILSVRLSLSVSFSLHFLSSLCVCAFHSLPRPPWLVVCCRCRHCPYAVLASSVKRCWVANAVVIFLTVAGSFLRLPPHPLYTLHSPLCPLFGRFICVGGKVSRRLVLPLVLSLFLSLLFFHTILLCYVFCLFCIICCLCLPCPALLCGSPASSAHKFYLYIFRYFPTAFVVVVHILWNCLFFWWCVCEWEWE